MKTGFNYVALGERVRKARKQKHITQEQLAELCNLSTAHIGHIERGTRALSIESLIMLAQVLEVTTDYLLLDITNLPPQNLLTPLHSLSGLSQEKRDTLYHVIKILAENADEL
ncbi:MAG: helix-turn-helix transcriptional regulator [Clostridia bacterium]|nr:helix-turn-helix transcriptional regulator [Clostridia bacterium]